VAFYKYNHLKSDLRKAEESIIKSDVENVIEICTKILDGDNKNVAAYTWSDLAKIDTQ